MEDIDAAFDELMDVFQEGEDLFRELVEVLDAGMGPVLKRLPRSKWTTEMSNLLKEMKELVR